MEDKAFTFNFGDSNQLVAAFQQPTEEELRKQVDEQLVKNNPRQVVERIRVLQNLQAIYDELKDKCMKEIYEVEKKYEQKYQPLYARRREIVSGTVDITEEEKGKALAKVENKVDESTSPADVKGIPEFWLTVLRNSEIYEDMIQKHDEEALKFLEDITAETLENEKGEANGFKLHFHFAENPYFTKTVLTKTFHYNPEDDEPISSEGTEIQWKEGKNLTVKTTIKKQRHKGGNRVRKVKKEVPQDSFFNFFKTLKKDENKAAAESDDEEIDTEALIAADQEIGDIFKTRIIAFAIEYFLGIVDLESNMDQFLNQLQIGDEDEDDEQDDDDDDDEQPQQARGRGRGAGRGGYNIQAADAGNQAECRQQ